MDVLKFSTAGSVDDGKSTLIGRLLYDTNSIPEDQIEAVINANKKRGNSSIDLALLTDGLIAEREQGITIDVSYKYFTTSKRKYIISDCPGHIEYTKNMITGVSNTDLIILLIDARKGTLEQTKRHYYIAKMMGISKVIVCVNKMDLVNFSQDVFDKIKNDFIEITKADANSIHFIPTVALKGDNIVSKSSEMDWYNGHTVFQYLEQVKINDLIENKFRFPVQYVIRNQSSTNIDYRGLAGRIESGSISVGDQIKVYPSGLTAKVTQINVFKTKVKTLSNNAYGTILLDESIDISRGDMLVKANEKVNLNDEINGLICWMDSVPFTQKIYLLKHGTNEIKCKIIGIDEVLNLQNLTFENISLNKGIQQNEIVKAKIKLSKPILSDKFSEIKQTGCFILIDEQTNQTVASGTIL